MAKKIFSTPYFRSSMLAVLAVTFSFVVVAGLAPRRTAHVLAEPNCPPIDTNHAIFNPYPIDLNIGGTNCNDFPVLSGGVSTDSSWHDSFQANTGDSIRLRIYMHNGAPSDSGYVMHNVSYSLSMDSNPGSQHSLSATITGTDDNGNIQTKTSSITIQTPDGAYLELTDGSAQGSIGDMNACFDYSKAVILSLRVVGGQASGHISGSLGGQVGSQCLQDATISWTTQNVSSVEVDVIDPTTQQQKVFSKDPNSADAPWIQPGQDFWFILYDISNGAKNELDRTKVTGNLTCNQHPSSFNLSVAPNSVCVNQTSTFNISNATSDLNGQQVFWDSTKNGAATGEHLAGYGQVVNNGSWQGTITWNSSQVGDWTKTASFVDPNGNIIATQTTPVFHVLPLSDTSCGGGQPMDNFSVSTNSANYCVGTIPGYTVTGAVSLVGQKILWSSYKGTTANAADIKNHPTTEINTDYGFVLITNPGNPSLSYWQAYGSPWTLNDVGYWIKSATVNGKSVDSQVFQVRDCSTTTNPPLQCTPANQTVLVNQPANIQASGGNGSYTVTSSDGTPFSFGGSGTNIYSGTFTTSGGKTVTVNDSAGDTAAVCNVTVNPVATPVNGVCGSANNATLTSPPSGSSLCNSGTASAVAGSGPWSWTCAGANGGSSASCSANKQGPVCVPATTGTIIAPDTVAPNQTFNLSCNFGSASDFIPAPTGCSFTGHSGSAANFSCNAPANPGPVTYSCQPQNQTGFTNFCSSPGAVAKVVQVVATAVPGVCGSASNATLTSAPSGSSLCNSGTASAVAGSGPWAWTCSGANGGLPASCSANKQGPVCVPPTIGTITAPASVNPGQTFTVSCDFGSANDFIPAPSGCNFTNRTGSTANFSCAAPSTPGSASYICQPQNQTGFTNFCSLPAAVSKTVVVNTPQNPLVCVLLSPSTVNGSVTGPSDLVSYQVQNSNSGQQYTWAAQNAAPFAGVGANFSTRFNANITSGNVTLTSNGQNVSCPTVNINITQLPNLVCTATPSSANIGQTIQYAVTGGTGSYGWSNATGNPDTAPPAGNINFYSTTYQSGGSKTVTVTSGVQTTVCGAQVNQASPQAIVQITKEVRNVTNNENFSQITTAKSGDTVEYRVTVSPGNSVALSNVTVTDTIHAGLNYVDGSLTVNGSAHATGLTSGGLQFSSVDSNKLVIVYRYTVPANAAAGSIQNTATATAQNANNTATAQALLSITNVPAGQPGLSIIKQVKNLGPSQTTGFASSVNAQKGDSVQYQIVVQNTGSAAAQNVFISDSNPLPASNVSVTGSVTGAWPNISVASLNAGQSITIVYNAAISQTSGSVFNQASVSANNAATQNSTAVVNVTSLPNNNGNINNTNTCLNGSCNNSTTTTSTTTNSCLNGSCNTNNTNTNTFTDNSQRTTNSNNITSSYNTTTNTNSTNTNTNTTTNTYYYYASVSNPYTNPIPASQYLQLNISKLVRNLSGGAFQKSVTVNSGDTAQFEVDVTNSGNQPVNNVQLSDPGVNGLQWIAGTTQVDGNSNANWNGNSLYLGTMYTGQVRRVTFQARVFASGNTSIQNVASVTGDNVPQRQDDAWVFVNNQVYGQSASVLGASVNLIYSKKAWNDTKNVDASALPASKEDFITYTLTVANNGNAPADNFVITDDLSQVLPYADMTDNGGGGVSGNVISYPGLTVPAGGSVSKSFRVRVKFFLADNLNYVMTNTYGNTVKININSPRVAGAFIAPKTGAETNAFAFAGIMVTAFGLARKRKIFADLVGLIFT